MAKEYTLRDAGCEVDMPTISGGMKTDKYYQSVKFDISALPEMASWEVGSEYLVIMKVRETSHSIEDDGEGTEEEARFDVLEVGAYKPEVAQYGPMVSKKLNLLNSDSETGGK